MTGFVANIEEKTLANNNFREVLFTGTNLQLVVMSLGPSEEIGMEVHPNIDQFFRFEKGEGKVVMNGEEHPVVDGDTVIVPAGTEHNVIAGKDGLKLYTIYAPPHHPSGTIHSTKEEAMKAEEHE